MIVGLILAGGGSRRMGREKALVPLGGQPLIAHVAAALAPQVVQLAVNAGGDASRFAALGLPVLPDTGWEDAGPLAGLATGLRWAAGRGAAALVTAPCDTPFLPGDLAARLHRHGPAAHAASLGRAHPACAIWPPACLPALGAWLTRGNRKFLHFASSIGSVAVDFPATADNDPFLNVNSPGELAEAERRLAQRATAPRD